jgi:hypothetical protein
LSEKEIFLSPLDLGKDFVQPGDDYIPTIRLAMPVFVDRELQGVVVIDINAREQLAKLGHVANEYPWAQVYMVNSDGYFLLHPIKEMEWGFTFKGRERSNMQHVFPRSWEEMLRDKEGVVLNNEGYFIYTTLYPLRGVQELQEGKHDVFKYFSRGLGTRDFSWIVFIRAPYDRTLWDIFRNVMVYYMIAYCVFLALWVVMRRKYGADTKLTGTSSQAA